MDHRSLILAATRTLIDHVDELTELDSAIGDGDHGLNMKRGALAIQARLKDGQGRRLAQRDAEGRRRHLHEHHRRLVGAGVRHPADDARPGACLRARAARSRRRAGRGHRRADPPGQGRGRAEDPARRARPGAAPARRQRPGTRPTSRPGCGSARFDSAAATAAMDAIRGRASFLGERALGHVDPGSRSMALIIAAICDGLSEARTTP